MRAVILLLLVAATASGQSISFKEDKLTCKAGRTVQVEFKYDGKDPRWDVIGEDVDAFRIVPDTDVPNTVVLRVQPFKDGQTVTVVAWCAKGDKSSPKARCVIQVGEPAPPAPPTPPNPPPDPPTPPGPADPLTAKLQAAFAADAGSPTDKAAWLVALRGVYEAMPDHVRQLPDTATTADMLADLRAAVSAVVHDQTALAGVRGVLRDEIAATLGTAVVPLDKPKTQTLFTRLAKSLGGVR